jgi:hypothetical protein
MGGQRAEGLKPKNLPCESTVSLPDLVFEGTAEKVEVVVFRFE